MIDYRKYINALRKCAKEHENDRTFTGHIIVSDLCRDTANLLEELEQEPTTKNDKVDCQHTDCNNCVNHKYCDYEPTTKNNLGVDAISREQALRELKESAEHHANDSREETLLRRDRDIIRALPPVTPQEPKPMVEIDLYSVIKQKYIEREVLDKIRAEIENGTHHFLDGEPIIEIKEVLQIIDKYKAETEKT